MEQTFQEQEVLRRVRRELYLTEGLSAMDDESLRTLIRKILLRQNPDHDFSAEELSRFVDTLYGNFRGLGILEEYLNDDTVSEIMINAWDVLFIERNGEVERSPRYHPADRCRRRPGSEPGEPHRGHPAARRRTGQRGPAAGIHRDPGGHHPAVPEGADHHADPRRVRDVKRGGSGIPRRAGEGEVQHLHQRRHELRQNDLFERAFGLHPEERTHHHHRRQCGTAADRHRQPDPAGDPQFQYRRQRGDHHPGAHPDLPAHAAGTHHRRGSPGRGGPRHARRHEHRSRSAGSRPWS